MSGSKILPNLIDLGERDLVRFILSHVKTLYEFFNFVVEPAIGPPPRQGWDYIFLAEVDRSMLGLQPGTPGDIDVLIVPTFHGAPRVDQCCAIEVKRLALRGPNWTKNVDRYGISQARGLLADGFPFVGILHIVIANQGPEENVRQLERWRIIDEYGRAEPAGSELKDMTGYDAAERQVSRLLSQSCPVEVGVNSLAIGQDERDGQAFWQSSRASGTRFASINPNVDVILLASIEALLHKKRSLISLRPADSRT